MSKGRYHIISRGGKWALKRENAVRPQKIYTKKADAVEASAKYQKENFDIIVHDKTGAVSEWRKAK